MGSFVPAFSVASEERGSASGGATPNGQGPTLNSLARCPHEDVESLLIAESEHAGRHIVRGAEGHKLLDGLVLRVDVLGERHTVRCEGSV